MRVAPLVPLLLVAMASPAAAQVTQATFHTPAGLGVTCSASDVDIRGGVGVGCQSVRAKPSLYQQRVTLSGSGRVTICHERGYAGHCKLGDSGEEKIPTYRYGKVVDVGRFRCRVLRSGVRCTVRKTGKGFVIDRDRAARI